jgi:SAM-dependent methyltransferase
MKRGRDLWTTNERDYDLALSKWDKLVVGTYIILSDYAVGVFPPRFEDQAKAYAAERDYLFNLPGVSPEVSLEKDMRKPFWFGGCDAYYLSQFMMAGDAMKRVGVAPPQKALEIGCGLGWMAEFFALSGFDVVATTISDAEVKIAEKRVESIRAKGIEPRLSFRSTPAEVLAESVADVAPFDVIYAYEALHHVFDWRKSLESAARCLKPGGWLFLFNEPNRLHTFVSYRIARLVNTHEIGFKIGEVKQHLRALGFTDIHIISRPPHLLVKPFSIAARKPNGNATRVLRKRCTGKKRMPCDSHSASSGRLGKAEEAQWGSEVVRDGGAAT